MALDQTFNTGPVGFLPTAQPTSWRPLSLPRINTGFSQVLAQRVQARTRPAAVNPTASAAFGSRAMLAGQPQKGGADQIQSIVNAAAQKYGVDPALISAVIEMESNFNPDAVSQAGAKGLMQLMDATAQGLGVTDSFDPGQNVMGGARLLRQLLDRYQGDTRLALAAYNAGPAAVDRFGGIPPYGETQRYVPKVLAALQRQMPQASPLAYQSVPQRSEQWR